MRSILLIIIGLFCLQAMQALNNEQRFGINLDQIVDADKGKLFGAISSSLDEAEVDIVMDIKSIKDSVPDMNPDKSFKVIWKGNGSFRLPGDAIFYEVEADTLEVSKFTDPIIPVLRFENDLKISDVSENIMLVMGKQDLSLSFDEKVELAKENFPKSVVVDEMVFELIIFDNITWAVFLYKRDNTYGLTAFTEHGSYDMFCFIRLRGDYFSQPIDALSFLKSFRNSDDYLAYIDQQNCFKLRFDNLGAWMYMPNNLNDYTIKDSKGNTSALTSSVLTNAQIAEGITLTDNKSKITMYIRPLNESDGTVEQKLEELKKEESMEVTTTSTTLQVVNGKTKASYCAGQRHWAHGFVFTYVDGYLIMINIPKGSRDIFTELEAYLFTLEESYE